MAAAALTDQFAFRRSRGRDLYVADRAPAIDYGEEAVLGAEQRRAAARRGKDVARPRGKEHVPPSTIRPGDVDRRGTTDRKPRAQRCRASGLPRRQPRHVICDSHGLTSPTT